MYLPSIPYFLPSRSNVQSPGSRSFGICASESLSAPRRVASVLSSFRVPVSGICTTVAPGAQTRGSVNCGLMPRAGPPVPTIGPLPCSSSPGRKGRGRSGSPFGTMVGATSGGSDGVGLFVRTIGRPLPPERAGSVSLGSPLGMAMNPMRSTTGGVFPSLIKRAQSTGNTKIRTSKVMTTTCATNDTNTAPGPRRVGSRCVPGVLMSCRRGVVIGCSRALERGHRAAHD